MIFQLNVKIEKSDNTKKQILPDLNKSALVNFFIDNNKLNKNVKSFLTDNEININQNLLSGFLTGEREKLKTAVASGKPDLLILIKTKPDKKFTTDFFRDAISKIIQELEKENIENLNIIIPSFDLYSAKFADESQFYFSFIEGLWLGNYTFSYKSKKEKNQKLNVTVQAENDSLLRKNLKQIENVLTSVYFARDLVNEPANVLTPQVFVEKIKKVFSKSRVSVKVIYTKEMLKLGMNLVLAVGGASDISPRLLVLHYKPTQKSKRKIALVGKGVTYDSGGLSIKPTSGMIDMKGDMAGAASVVGTILAASKNNLPVELFGVMPLVENMISGKSYKPGDVIKSYSGKTVEVKDTDAEGRLVLADAITYACKFKPELLIDYATLTGACVVALGEIASGMFTNEKKYSETLKSSADYTYERIWELPMWYDYDSLLESKIADVSNLGPRWGGAITAAKFLENFVEENIPWVHLDIAGPALKHKENSYTENYDTGFGVRLTYDFLKRMLNQ